MRRQSSNQRNWPEGSGQSSKISQSLKCLQNLTVTMSHTGTCNILYNDISNGEPTGTVALRWKKSRGKMCASFLLATFIKMKWHVPCLSPAEWQFPAHRACAAADWWCPSLTRSGRVLPASLPAARHAPFPPRGVEKLLLFFFFFTLTTANDIQ